MYTHFPRLRETDRTEARSTDLLTDLLEAEHIVTEAKDVAPLFGPYELEPGASRGNSGVVAVHYAVLDFDGPDHEGLDADQTEDVIRSLEGFEVAIASSYGNTSERAKFRAVLRLARPVDPGEWGHVFRRLGEQFPARDSNPSAVGQAYYWPSCPSEHRDAAFQIHLEGRPWDPDEVSDNPTPRAAPEKPAPPTSGAPIAREALSRLIKRLQGSSDPGRHDVARMLSAIREGVSFADPGKRDVSLFCVVTELAKSFRGIKLETLQATLQQSIDRMVQDETDTFGRDLPSKLVRANEYLLSADRAKVVPPTATRIEPRTVNELFQCLALEKGEDPLKHLILQHNRDMYLATSDKTYGLQYVYTSKEGILRQVSDKFDRFGVDLFKRSGDETRRLQPQELIDTYGTPIESVSYSFTSRQPMIRRKGAERNLLLPAAREPEPMPQFTQEIHDWLTILGGGSSLLLDWATLALDTSRPLAALVLLGTPGTGKSLFAQQLARYWTRDSPPTLDDALGGKGGFNEILLSCPLVFADEGQIPRDRREQPRSREIRELVQKGKHTINAKHRAPSYLEGYPRIIIAANNDNVLDFGEALSADDIEAIRQRLRVVNVGQEAADFLKQQDIVGWVKDNLIAKHVAWYAEEMDVVHQGRFGIPPDDAGLLQFSFGLQGAVFEWLVKSIMHPNRVRLGTVVDQDRHVVRVRMVDIESYWTHFLERGKPTISSIARAVSPYVVKGSGTIEIPWHAILRWVERSNYCSADEIVNALLNYGSQRTLVAV